MRKTIQKKVHGTPLRTKVVVAIFLLFMLAVALAQVWGLPTYVNVTVFGYDNPDTVNSYGTNDTVTFAHTVGAGDDRLLVVAVGVTHNEPVNDVQWGEGGTAQAMSRAGYVAGTAGWRTELWYLVAPTVRSDSIFIDIGSSHAGGGHAALNFTNVLQTDPIAAVASNSAATGTEIINAITTTYDSSTVLTVNMSHGADTRPYSPSAGQVELYDTVYGVKNWDPATWGGYLECVSAGSHPCTLTASGSDDWAILSIEIRQAGALDLVDTCCSHTQGDTIDFGLVDTISARAIDWTLLNCGDSTIADTASISGHPYFTMTSDSIWSIASYEEAEITFTFTPTELGVVTATVLSGEDSCGGIVLKGEGIAYVAAPSSAYYLRPPYVGGGYRAGDDGFTGTHPDSAWATLDHAESQLEAGDTLMIMGGEYDNAQRMSCNFSVPGTAAHPIVLKAYGDAVARFTNTGSTGRGEKQYFLDNGNTNHFVLDGCSFLTGDSLYLVFVADVLNGIGAEQGVQYMFQWGTSTTFDTGLVIRGCEFDGSPVDELATFIDGNRSGFNSMFRFSRMTDVLIEKNYIHNVNRPTGCWHDSSSTEGMWGDQTDRDQGSGEGFFLDGSNRVIVRNNTFERMNHGIMGCDWDIAGGDTAFVHYMQIVNNKVEQRRGGYFYLYMGTHHVLVEGNIFTHAGQSASFKNPTAEGDCNPKAKGLQISGDYMTIRKNVFYTPENDGLALSSNRYSPTFGYSTRHNRIYNNTVYKSFVGWAFMINQRALGTPTAYSRHNRIFNNIFYDPDSLTLHGPNVPAVIYVYDYEQQDEDIDMIDPNVVSGLPYDTHFGWNYFANNLMGRDSTDTHRNSMSYDSMVAYAGPSVMDDHTITFSLDTLEARDPTGWRDNKVGSPDLAGPDPDAYGLFSGWWYPNAGSEAIDAGRRMTGDFVDDNGAYVEANAQAPPPYFSEYGITTYGWSDTLAWTGTAPDIGAYESPAAGEACCDVENMVFGGVPRSTTATDSFPIINCGDSTLVDSLDWDLDAAFVLASDSAYTILGGDTTWFTVEFTPTVAQAYLDTLDGGALECVDIIFSGTGTVGDTCCAIPFVLSFAYVDVATTATDSFYIANCGDSALIDSIDWDLLPVFVLASDSAFSITSGDTAWFAVEFTPLTPITYVDTLLTAQMHPECGNAYGGVIIAGLGQAGDTCCTVATLSFGAVTLDSTAVDSFSIINCGDSALVDSVDWASGPLYVLASDSSYSIAAGDTAWFTVEFTPVAAGGYPEIQDAGHAVCADLALYGWGRNPSQIVTIAGAVIWARGGLGSNPTAGVFGTVRATDGGAGESCSITDSDITTYRKATGQYVVWTSSEADSGHVRWDETGNTTWNYGEETGDDSTSHYVVVTGWTPDFVGYDLCLRTGTSDCYSEWSDALTVYTTCGDDTVTLTSESWDGFLNNRLRVDPLYKNKVMMRYKMTIPTPGDWVTSSWLGTYTITAKTWSFGTLAASATYTWEYNLQDPCSGEPTWVAVGTFTTNGSGEIE